MLKSWSERLPQQIESGTTRYDVRVIGSERDDHTWEARLAFFPAGDGVHRPLMTDFETTQPNEKALRYWITGIEPVYLEGALRRAERRAKPGAARVVTLQPIETYVLDLFRNHDAARLPVDRIFAEGGTYANADIVRAMQNLEHLHLIVRITENGIESVYLTESGLRAATA